MRDYLREEAITKASLARYPSGRRIDASTFWRWCDALELKKGAEFFTQTDMDRLCALAMHLADGGTVNDYIRKELNEHSATKTDESRSGAVECDPFDE